MNSEEFNTFYRRYYKVSVKIANGIVQSRFTAEDVTQEVFSYFYEIKERLDASSEEKLPLLVVWKTTNKGRDYLRKSYVKREVMFDNDVAELQYRTTESAEAALLGLEKQMCIRDRYHACESCSRGQAPGSTVYITKSGNRYHNDKNCSGLPRSVRLVQESAAGNLHACKRCG